jgi:hypothetical protein
MPNAKLGAKVDRYSFFVRFLPPLLHTGLARRTNIAIALIFRLLSHSFDLNQIETSRNLSAIAWFRQLRLAPLECKA